MRVRVLTPIFGLAGGEEVYAEALDALLMGDAQSAGGASLYDQQGVMLGLAHKSRFVELVSPPAIPKQFASAAELLAAYAVPGSGLEQVHWAPTPDTHPVAVQVTPLGGQAYFVGPFEGVRQAHNWMNVTRQQVPWLGTLDIKNVAQLFGAQLV